MPTLAEGEARTIVVAPSGPPSNTLTAVLPPGVTISLESVLAAIDATGAGDTTALLEIADSSGAVIARKRQGEKVTGGGTGSATWALRLGDESVAAAVTSPITKVADSTRVTAGTFNVVNAFRAGFDYLEMHLWAKLPTATYGAGPGTVRAQFMDGGATLNKWRLLAGGSATNISVAGGDSSAAVGFVPMLPNTAGEQAAYSYTTVRWFAYQSQLGYKDWISEGMVFDQAFTAGGPGNYVNRWTGGGWLEGTTYPGLFGNVALKVYPNANPSTTAGAPDLGKFAAGSRLLILGYKGT